MTNLADNLTATAKTHPDRPAVRLDDMTLSYAELQDGARRVAALLKDKGVGPGDRVGLVLPNVPAVPGAVLRRAGGRRRRRADEPAAQGPRGEVLPRGLRRLDRLRLEGHGRGGRQGRRRRSASSASRSSPTASSTCSAQHEPDEDVVDRDDDDTVVLLYTSGTTGQPKGAELTHANMITNAAVSAETLVELSEDDVVMGCLPLFHCFGLTCGLNAAVLNGACLTLIPRFDADEGARGHRPRQGHRLRGRPDDVRRDAARRGPRVLRRLEPAHLHLGRLRDAGRGDEEVREDLRLHRARGLRALRDLAGRLVQPARTSSASPARSACPCAASR